ncbi:Serine/threonine-protein kinase TOR [Mycena venus]|uniref:Serine/threonine-protein kinase TOR n=1 Tax=Mycena venus TaxID=2733690 RepID=A0A8H6YPV0_9AGAR|nr:Serine/threonine-protein kinase TOR [Mycena venus]
MAHLLSQLERGPERDYALIAIGHTTTAVGADMKLFLETIMSHIKARFKDAATQAMAASGGASARSRPPPPPDPLLAALGLLAAAVGPMLTMLLHDHFGRPKRGTEGMSGRSGQGDTAVVGRCAGCVLLFSSVSFIFPTHISRTFYSCDANRLLNLLSHILSGTPYTRLGAPPHPPPQGG